MSSAHVGFVAGATGYTGRAVVAELRRRAIPTIAHVRPDSSRLDHWRRHFEQLGAQLDSSPWEPAAIQAAMHKHQPTLLFALLGTTQKRAKKDAGHGADSSYEAVDYGLSAMLLQAAECSLGSGSGALPRYVYLSAAGVGESAGRPGGYMHARWKVERDLQASALPFTIARPSFITGPGRDEDRPMERIGAAVADQALGLVGLLGGRTIRDRYRSTSNEELARALVRLALDPAAANGIFHSEKLRA